jgi:glycosyltransferase involved in cell wall biosynthesis
MKVLALCSVPSEAAATRFRLDQFVRPLFKRGIELTIEPFMDSVQFHSFYRGGHLGRKVGALASSMIKRSTDVIAARNYDLIYVQREAMIFGPAVVESLIGGVWGIPMVLDLDDATYVRYVSPTYGRIGSWLKFFGKTDRLIERAAVVTCGNPFIAEYVEKRGTRAVVLPTVVDLEEFRPREKASMDRTLVIGWIGTHSTFPFVQSIFPVLQKLSQHHKFKLDLVGTGSDDISLKNIVVENRGWSMQREAADFAALDIGLYPITTSASADEEWIKGKSGFKAVQYMSVGIPFVMSPVGVCALMGQPGTTHFNAVSEEDWYNSLNTLLLDRSLRAQMGAAGRAYALANYQIDDQAEVLARTFREVAGKASISTR